MPFLESANGDPVRSQRRIAVQATRGLPAAESLYRDFRQNGGPFAISQTSIPRQVIGRNGEPMLPLTGKRTIGGGPLDFGDMDPSSIGTLILLGSLFGAYDFEDLGAYNRWTFYLGAGTAFPTFFSALDDSDINPRVRLWDGMFGGLNLGATSGGNFSLTAPFVVGYYDLYGAVAQTEGGQSALAITSITRASSTATATTTAPHGLSTGDVVVVSGATETEYNGNFVVTVTGASAFTYTVSGTPTTPATGTPVYATNGLSITGITRSGSTATVTTAVAHGLATGDTVRVSGASQAGYNLDATVTVTGATTFTYTVASGTVTPATGTIVYERLDGAVPVLRNTYSGSWLPDATDADIFVELVSYDGVDTWTLRAKTSSAASYSSTFTAKAGLDSADNPIFTRMVDEDGESIGPWSDQVRIHLPASGLRIGNVYRFPKRRARWVQELDTERPISSVGLSALVAPEVGEDLEEVRFEGGIAISVAWDKTEAIQDTPGRQGATVRRTGELKTTAVLTRQITDLRMQRGMHEATPMPLVLDAKTDVYIPSTTRPYRFLAVLANCRLTGTLYGVAPGGQNTDEAPVFEPGYPDDALVYDGITVPLGSVVFILENDIAVSDVTG
jgi:hypothetical protein